MGDFADDAVDAALNGMMNFDDFGDEFFEDDPDLNFSRRRRSRPPRTTCAFCGETDLHWDNVAGGYWRLHTYDGKVHSCAEREKGLGIERLAVSMGRDVT